MKTCSKCRRDLPLDEFWANRSTKDGKHPQCRSCRYGMIKAWRGKNAERLREYNSRYVERVGREVVAAKDARYRRSSQDKINEAQRTRRAAEPAKDRARDAVRRAVRRGALKRPTSCEQCGGSGRIEASHDDYDQPLVVEWLCVPCHRRKDADARARVL